MLSSCLHRLLAAMALVTFMLPASAVAQVPGIGPAGSDQTTDQSSTDALQSLLDVLQDDAARDVLVTQLQDMLAEPAEQVDEIADVDQTFARRLADQTATFAEDGVETITTVWRDFSGVRTLFAELPDNRRDRIRTAWLPLVMTIVTSVAILWSLTRLVAAWLRSRRRESEPSNWRSTSVTVVTNAIADIVVLIVAYTIGHVLALTVLHPQDDILVEQSLFLNAFVVAGIVRIIVRIFLLPDRPEQALSHLAPNIQRTAYRRVKALNFLLVYGITVAVPIANTWFSLAAGRSVRIIVVTLAAILALMAIYRISGLVKAQAHRMLPPTGDPAAEETETSLQAAAGIWNRIWPWIAVAYVAATYVIAVTQPRLMADHIGLATIKSVIALILGSVAVRLFRYAPKAHVPAVGIVLTTFAELKRRLDSMAPTAVRVVAFLLLIGAVALFIDAWGILDIGGWITSDTGSAVVWRVISALLIVIVIVLLWSVISSWIDHRLDLNIKGTNVSARSRTLLSLFRNAFTVAIFIFGMMIAMSQLGIDIAPLLAGAGVIGLAIGFGSQKLVQDIITGVFIQLENAINEGDVVTLGGTTGVVEHLTIRSVGLRDLDGIYHIVPFSSVDMVSNYMRKFSYHVAVFGVAYKENLSNVKDAMFEAFERLRKTEDGPYILEDLEMQGVVALSDSSVDVRARIKTLPGRQFALGRAYTELVKEVFDERGIEIPFPHRQLIMTAPPSDTEEDG